MTRYAFPPIRNPVIPIAESRDLFPAHRIFCVGRNYIEHAREMGMDSEREMPFFFMKPINAILTNGADFQYPAKSENVQHEIELVVAIGKGGQDIPQSIANDHVFGYACGLDMGNRQSI